MLPDHDNGRIERADLMSDKDIYRDFTASEFAKLSQHDYQTIQRHDPIVLSERHGDHRLNPDLGDELSALELRPAAVLIPVIADEYDARVILTVRTEKLRKHSGQVAFAGGAVDQSDASAESAAMREAEEEIGLSTEYVEAVGQLPIYRSLTGFSITPVLAVVKSGFSLTANPDEVDEIFEVSLRDLMNPDNHVRDSLVWKNKRRHYYTIKHRKHRIWGVTAGMIRTLYERLYL